MLGRPNHFRAVASCRFVATAWIIGGEDENHMIWAKDFSLLPGIFPATKKYSVYDLYGEAQIPSSDGRYGAF